MIAPRLLAKASVTRQLRELGYERIDQDDIPDHSYWKTPWNFHFFVPELGPDGRCGEFVLGEILREVAGTRPTRQ